MHVDAQWREQCAKSQDPLPATSSGHINSYSGSLLPEIQSGHRSDAWTQTDRKTRSVLIFYIYIWTGQITAHNSPPHHDGVFCGSSSFAVSWSHWDQAMVKPGLGSGLAGLSSRTSPLDQTEAGNILRSVSVCGFHPQSSRGPAQKKKKIQKAQADWKLS